MSGKEKRRRITLWLDSALLMEQLIVNRLDETAPARREDWLRSLLVTGYLQQARVFRALQDRAPEDTENPIRTPWASSVPPSNYAHWFGQARRPVERFSETDDQVPPGEPVAPGDAATEKPFAMLRKLIG